MAKKVRRNNGSWQRFVPTVLYLLGYGFLGFWIAFKGILSFEPGGFFFGYLIVIYACLYLGSLINTVIHEAGHLVFGLATGYKFGSFRVLSFTWAKIDGRLRFRRYSLAGTAGQCLMDPPDLVDGKIPVMLYNLGGPIMSLIGGVVFLLLHIIAGRGVFSMFLLVTGVLGIMFALTNGLPLRLGMVNNDGYNALKMAGDPLAIRIFWAELKTSTVLLQGGRMRDIPAEWLQVPDDADLTNSRIVTAKVQECNRLIDCGLYEEADESMRCLLENPEAALIDLYRYLLTGERLYIELTGQNRPEIVNKWYDKKFRRFAASMSKYISVIRMEYAYALLAEWDEAKAEKILARFEKAAARYPYKGDVESERAMIERARLCHEARRENSGVAQ